MTDETDSAAATEPQFAGLLTRLGVSSVAAARLSSPYVLAIAMSVLGPWLVVFASTLQVLAHLAQSWQIRGWATDPGVDALVARRRRSLATEHLRDMLMAAPAASLAACALLDVPPLVRAALCVPAVGMLLRYWRRHEERSAEKAACGVDRLLEHPALGRWHSAFNAFDDSILRVLFPAERLVAPPLVAAAILGSALSLAGTAADRPDLAPQTVKAVSSALVTPFIPLNDDAAAPPTTVAAPRAPQATFAPAPSIVVTSTTIPEPCTWSEAAKVLGVIDSTPATLEEAEHAAVSRNLLSAWTATPAHIIGCPSSAGVKVGDLWVVELIEGNRPALLVATETSGAIVYSDYRAALEPMLVFVAGVGPRTRWGLGTMQPVSFRDGSCSVAVVNDDGTEAVLLPAPVAEVLADSVGDKGGFAHLRAPARGDDPNLFTFQVVVPADGGVGYRLGRVFTITFDPGTGDAVSSFGGRHAAPRTSCSPRVADLPVTTEHLEASVQAAKGSAG